MLPKLTPDRLWMRDKGSSVILHVVLPASKRLEALATRLEALADRKKGGAGGDGERGEG